MVQLPLLAAPATEPPTERHEGRPVQLIVTCLMNVAVQSCDVVGFVNVMAVVPVKPVHPLHAPNR